MPNVKRRTVIRAIATAPLATAAPLAFAQRRKDSVVLAIVLEPPGLDPTTGAAAAIGEIVHYNVLEGLTKINVDGSVTPLLAESWSAAPDGKAYTFQLRKGVKFSDGAAFDANAVKFSFDRARDPKSTNKAKKALFENISSVAVHDPHSLTLVLAKADATLPFRLGENTAVILHPDSVAQAATKPVGTGGFVVESWSKGSAVVLAKSPAYRDAAKVRLVEGHLPLHQRPGRAGGGAAGRRHRRHAALRRPAGRKGLKGLWNSSPIFANDMAAVSWAS